MFYSLTITPGGKTVLGFQDLAFKLLLVKACVGLCAELQGMMIKQIQRKAFNPRYPRNSIYFGFRVLRLW